jgi:hypothetical protein
MSFEITHFAGIIRPKSLLKDIMGVSEVGFNRDIPLYFTPIGKFDTNQS